MTSAPEHVKWLFWDVDKDALQLDESADYVLARILEFGGMAEVRWALRYYGLDRIHRFFKEVGHSEISPRTIAFWRAALRAEDEEWAKPPDWRRSARSRSRMP